MKKIILFLLIVTFVAEAQRPRRADEQRSARSPYAQSILWRDLHKSTQDSIRQAVADSLAALSADGVTIVNSSGTFGQKVFANVAAAVAATGTDGQVIAIKTSAYDGYGTELFFQADSAFPEDGINALNNATAGKQWLRLRKSPWVLEMSPSLTFAEHTTLLNQVDDTSNVVVYMHPGYYNFGNIPDIVSARNLTIYGNGSTIKSSNDIQIITTAANTSFANNYTTGFAASVFTTNIEKDSFWVGVDDSTTWQGLSGWGHGAILWVADTTSGVEDKEYYNGDVFIFDKFKTNSQGGDSARMYFKNAAYTTIYKDSMATTPYIRYIAPGKSLKMHDVNFLDAGVVISGFSDVQMSNISIVNNGEPSASKVEYGVVFNKCGFVQVNNFHVQGINYPGLGYGIQVTSCFDARINNFSAVDTRHPIDVGSDLYAPTRLLVVSNASSLMTGRMYEDNLNVTGAFGLHGGVHKAIYENIYMENTIGGLGGRAQEIEVRNFTGKNIKSSVFVLNDVQTSQLRKKSIKIDGVKLYKGVTSVLAVQSDAGNTLRVGTIRMDNVEVESFTGTSASSGFITFAETGQITVDSIFASNLKMNGTGQEKVFSFPGSDGNEISYAEFDNIQAKNIDEVIKMGKPAIRTLRFKNSVIDSAANIFEISQNDTAALYIKDWVVSDNTIRNVTQAWEFGNLLNWTDNILFDNNRFYNTYGLLYFEKSKLGTVVFKNNELEFAGSASTIFDIPTILYGDGQIRWQRNDVVVNNTAAATLFRQFSTGNHNPKLIIDGGRYDLSNVHNFLRTEQMNFDLMNTVVDMDTFPANASFNDVLDIGANSDGRIINNFFQMNGGYTAWQWLFLTSSGDSVVVDKNTIINAGAVGATTYPWTGTTAGSHFKFGFNTVEGFTDKDGNITSATISYMPQTWGKFRYEVIADTVRGIFGTDTTKVFPTP